MLCLGIIEYAWGAKSYGFFAQRNPLLKFRYAGESESVVDDMLKSRRADRSCSGAKSHEPPRITLYFPLFGPGGFRDGLVA